MRTGRLASALVLGSAIAALTLAVPATARAVPSSILFAAANGSGNACTQLAPCGLETALAQAASGDTIYVAAGVYRSTGSSVLAITGKSLTLYGGWNGRPANPGITRWPDVFATRLDGQGLRRVVYIGGAVSVTLDGFAIVNGRVDQAGGIAVYDGATAVIRHNLIADNIAYGGWGGGIEIAGATALVEHNFIVANSAAYQGGGLVSASGSHVTLRNNLVAYNSAAVGGGGIRLHDTTATLVNNTIARNYGTGEEGILATHTALTLTNNIIALGGIGVHSGGAVTPVITYNDVWGNGANYVGMADPTGSNGNISQDPLFTAGPYASYFPHIVPAWGGYYLSQAAAGQPATSPAVDAGSGPAVNVFGTEHAYLTTRSDSVQDAGVADMGFHYHMVHIGWLALICRPAL